MNIEIVHRNFKMCLELWRGGASNFVADCKNNEYAILIQAPKIILYKMPSWRLRIQYIDSWWVCLMLVILISLFFFLQKKLKMDSDNDDEEDEDDDSEDEEDDDSDEWEIIPYWIELYILSKQETVILMLYLQFCEYLYSGA